ncbi:hypothetical protein Trco_000026 [Trichoderma cornu-damae]|uniref:RRM domain-containing protein n=1 Tax=Trichoderma cornu-damae TaxID=654480 RepID=A0A9P8QRM7_9HYPO|nr:hypothetical protein Trco_000026 [Trichoderma cornu-damae]
MSSFAMSTPGYTELKVDSFGFDEIPRSFCLSHSPESVKTATTPGTPDDVRSVFGDTISVPQSSSATRATNALQAFTHRSNDSISSISDFATATGGSKPILGPDIPRYTSNYGFGHQASQIWTPPSTRLDPGITVNRQNAAHPRWGSLDTQMNRRGFFVSHEDHISRFPSFMANQNRPAMLSSSANAVHSYKTEVATNQPFAHQLFAQRDGTHQYHDDAEERPMRRHAPAASSKSDSSFDLTELQNAMISSFYSDSSASQPLGIDVLRLSPPRVHPIRQPIPPPPPAQAPLNGQPHGFLPMQAVMQRTPPGAFVTEPSTSAFSSSKFSARYHGMHTETNASAEHLAPDQNCALWLTNLPPGVSTHQLLTAIRNVGRVWCSYVNYPDYVTHQTAAAKVVFFTPEASQQLLSISWTRGLFIQGFRVKVSHNRIKYGSHAITGKMSRILIITGNADFVNEASLTKFFKDRFIFQVDEVVELIKAGGRAVVEFKFGSYRCQAQMGKMSLEKDRPVGFEKVEFGDDPCEVGDTMTSYGIAAERIQGRGL